MTEPLPRFRLDPMFYRDEREWWSPAFHVPADVVCDFCWDDIPPTLPKAPKPAQPLAWFNRLRRVWECIGCRAEGFRAQMAQERSADAQAASSTPHPLARNTGGGAQPTGRRVLSE